MTLPLALLRELTRAAPVDAWAALFRHAWTVCAAELTTIKSVMHEVPRRDRALAAVDLFLSTAGWELWTSYLESVPRTAEALGQWWTSRPAGRAVLILDSLSLRELPWLLQEAAARGYTVHQARPTGAELPADTTSFARALGLSHRGVLANNAAPRTHLLAGAVTDSTDLPWDDCFAAVQAQPDWFLWHHWPDKRLHELAEPGHGVAALADEAARQLTSEAFWKLIHGLTTGRRLVITADHGYAASGMFQDTPDPAMTQSLRERFKSGRFAPLERVFQAPSGLQWVPPIDIVLPTSHQGECAFVLGRRKWKVGGGYPTLTHGGLSLLELAVPFVELSRT
jgi:hypothetical protein